jgi:hypothetical protein
LRRSGDRGVRGAGRDRVGRAAHRHRWFHLRRDWRQRNSDLPGTSISALRRRHQSRAIVSGRVFNASSEREKDRSSTWIMGAPLSAFAQRQGCQTFVAVPIVSGPEAHVPCRSRYGRKAPKSGLSGAARP